VGQGTCPRVPINLWETNNHDPPEGKIKRGYVPEINEAPDNKSYALYYQKKKEIEQLMKCRNVEI